MKSSILCYKDATKNQITIIFPGGKILEMFGAIHREKVHFAQVFLSSVDEVMMKPPAVPII
jgi:hypothetical protein